MELSRGSIIPLYGTFTLPWKLAMLLKHVYVFSSFSPWSSHDTPLPLSLWRPTLLGCRECMRDGMTVLRACKPLKILDTYSAPPGSLPLSQTSQSIPHLLSPSPQSQNSQVMWKDTHILLWDYDSTFDDEVSEDADRDEESWKKDDAGSCQTIGNSRSKTEMNVVDWRFENDWIVMRSERESQYCTDNFTACYFFYLR